MGVLYMRLIFLLLNIPCNTVIYGNICGLHGHGFLLFSIKEYALDTSCSVVNSPTVKDVVNLGEKV